MIIMQEVYEITIKQILMKRKKSLQYFQKREIRKKNIHN